LVVVAAFVVTLGLGCSDSSASKPKTTGASSGASTGSAPPADTKKKD